MKRTIRFGRIRRDAKLLRLPEEKRTLIDQWLVEVGVESCLRRIQKELGISTSRSALYRALKAWDAEARFGDFNDTAEAQVDMEEAAKGKLTPEEREAAIDRHFIVLAQSVDDQKLYQQLRYLRIADQKAKVEKRLAEAKVAHGTKALRQKDKALALADRKVVMLEKKIAEAQQATENKTLSAEERARRVREILGE